MFFLQILLNSLVLGTQILLIAIPLYLIYSVSKVFHLAVGAIATAIAYSFYLAVKLGGSFGFAALVSLLVGILFAIASYYLLDKFIERKQYLFALLISFSAGVALEALIAMTFGSAGKSIVEGVLPTFHFYGLNLTVPGFITITMGVIGLLCMGFVMQKTSFGRTLRSLAENSSSAESLGIDSNKTRFITYLIAIVITGFIGIMFGLNTALTPFMGFHTVILAFVAFLIGGTTNITGTFIASYLVAFVPQLVISYSNFSAAWHLVFVFILAAVLLLIRPKGLFYSMARNN